MKSILLSLFAFFFTNMLLAQDTIVKRNGEEIKAKVEEVGVSEIKYKKPDNPNGPLYAVLKTDVFVIKYENGSKEVFSNAEESPAVAPTARAREDRGRREDPGRHERAPRRDDRPHNSAVKKIVGGAIMTGMGISALLGGSGILALGISTYGYGDSFFDGPSIGLMATGSVFIAGGVVLEVLGPITLSRGIKEKRRGLSLNFTPIRNPMLDRYTSTMNKNKLGFTLTF